MNTGDPTPIDEYDNNQIEFNEFNSSNENNNSSNENNNINENNASIINEIKNYFNNLSNNKKNLNTLFLKLKNQSISNDEFRLVEKIISYLFILSSKNYNTEGYNFLKNNNFSIKEIKELYNFLVIIKLKRANDPYRSLKMQLQEQIQEVGQLHGLLGEILKEYRKIYSSLTSIGGYTRKSKKRQQKKYKTKKNRK